MNICWPFFSVIKLYVQFVWQSKTSSRVVICGSSGLRVRKRLDCQFPGEGWMGDSWPVLQKVGFALAEEAAVAPSLTFQMVLLPRWHLHFLNNAGNLCGGDE